jgi:hypothetical protein
MDAAAALPIPAFARAAVCFLALYQECIATGAWARLVFEMRGGEDRMENPAALRMCAQGSWHPAYAQRQEWQKCKREAWVARRKAVTAVTVPVAAVPKAATAALASKQAAEGTPAAATAALPAATADDKQQLQCGQQFCQQQAQC